MIQLFEKYITIAEDKKFDFSEYDISKEELQQLLNKIIKDYQEERLLGQSNEFKANSSSEMKI